jgi:hypothetical protein
MVITELLTTSRHHHSFITTDDIAVLMSQFKHRIDAALDVTTSTVFHVCDVSVLIAKMLCR